MSKDYIRHQIERINRAIDSEKEKIVDYRENITSIRTQKKRRAESYSYRIKLTSSSNSKANYRSSRADEWREFSRAIDRDKEKIVSSRERISKYRVEIKREREKLK